MSVRSPLLGYNHNLKYKGRIYHIQTEDSGETNPHIFTHLFHRGIIISTKKTEYKHLLGQPDYEEEVRKMMQVQHKDMMKSLLSGQWDEKIIKYFGGFSDEKEGEEKPRDVGGVIPLDPLGAQFSSDGKSDAKKTAKAPVPTPPAPSIPQAPQQRRRPAVANDDGEGHEKHQGTVIAQLPIIPGIPALGGDPAQFTKPQGGSMPGHDRRGMGKESSDFDDIDTNLDDMDWIDNQGTMPGSPNAGVIVAVPPPNFGAGGVVVSRPAIILTGENQSFGSFSSQKPKGNSALIDTGSFIEEDDDFEPDVNNRSSQHFYTRPEGLDLTPHESQPERPTRHTGPIQAPPGLFKPDNSKEIPNNIISLGEVDTKVDDIILDFLRSESATSDEPE